MRVTLKNRSLLILGLAESISNVGNWITMMALFALLLFRGQGGVAESSGIMLAGLGPMLLLGPVAGWLSDRFDRKRLMIASQLLSALPVVALLFADLILPGRDLLIYLLLAIQAAFISLMTPARQAAVPTLVEKKNLARANGFLQQLSSFVKIGAPMLGGALVAALGPRLAMALDVVTFLLAAAVLALLPALPPQDQSNAAPDKPSTPAPAVWSTLRGAPRLRLLFITLFLAVLVIMGFDILSVLVVRDVLRADETLFGLIIGLIGLGSVLASLIIMARKEATDPWRDVVIGLIGFAILPAATYIAGRVPDPLAARWLMATGALIGGFGNGFVIIQVGTLLQLLSPPAILGRMSGLLQSAIAAAQLITILLIPLLVPALLSVNTFFGLGALLLALLTASVALVLRRSPAPAVAGAPAGTPAQSAARHSI